MNPTIQPIFLLADSQLLFWQDDDADQPFLRRVRDLLPAKNPKAAYVGASNGDRPEFYSLFQGAMESIEVTDCRMIPAEPSREDRDFLDAADLILLAGGDPERGWRTFERNGLKDVIPRRYQKGAVLVGISAGAMQLGLDGFREPAGANGAEADADTIEIFETFKLVPFLIDVHQEPEWQRLTQALPAVSEYVQGLGIPSGAGAVIHPDMTVEPVRRPLVEVTCRGKKTRQNLILPPDGETETETATETEVETTGAENGAADPAAEPPATQPEIVFGTDRAEEKVIN